MDCLAQNVGPVLLLVLGIVLVCTSEDGWVGWSVAGWLAGVCLSVCLFLPLSLSFFSLCLE